MSFTHGVYVLIHRFKTEARGRQVKVSEHVLDGVAVSRATTNPGEFPVQLDESSRVLMSRDVDADVRSADYVTFPESHRLSGTTWQVKGEPFDYESPLSGYRAGLTFRIERSYMPEVT